MHPNRLQFKRPGGLSWPACPCGSGDGPLYFWGAHLAKLSPFTWRKERNGQVVLKRMERRPNAMGQIRPTCNNKKSGHSPWRLSRANRALVGAHSWGLGGFLGGSGWAKGGRKERMTYRRIALEQRGKWRRPQCSSGPASAQLPRRRPRELVGVGQASVDPVRSAATPVGRAHIE